MDWQPVQSPRDLTDGLEARAEPQGLYRWTGSQCRVPGTLLMDWKPVQSPRDLTDGLAASAESQGPY